jgi:hypothetical protein
VRHQREKSVHIPDGAEIGILRLRSFSRDGVIVKRDLNHSKLHFARLHLNASPFATTNDSFKQLVKLFNGVRPGANIITVYGEPVS